MEKFCEGCECERIEGLIRQAIWSSGREKIVIGLSGGIDSALAAVFCARAVGAENVLGYTLPSSVTPQEDLNDVKELCEQFGIVYSVVPITSLINTFEEIDGYVDSPYLIGNATSRLRMTVLYYFANLNNALVCGTTNKTEYLLGYSTKYGDGAADIEPLMHLYKRDVRHMSKYLGVPSTIITKAPSAGLYEGQTDEKEIGFTYDEIDSALVSLEEHCWTESSELEAEILKKVSAAAHKRCSPPNLLGLANRSTTTTRGCSIKK